MLLGLTGLARIHSSTLRFHDCSLCRTPSGPGIPPRFSQDFQVLASNAPDSLPLFQGNHTSLAWPVPSQVCDTLRRTNCLPRSFRLNSLHFAGMTSLRWCPFLPGNSTDASAITNPNYSNLRTFAGNDHPGRLLAKSATALGHSTPSKPSCHYAFRAFRQLKPYLPCLQTSTQITYLAPPSASRSRKNLCNDRGPPRPAPRLLQLR